jgi:hypothetical protein
MDPRAAKYSALPDWSGIWVAEGKDMDTGISGVAESGTFSPDVWGIDPSNPAPWNEDAAAFLAQAFKNAPKTGKHRNWGFPTMMQTSAPLQFLLTPEEAVIINNYADARHVYMDGRPHVADDDRWSTYWGDSVGHWEGDTLVIDTLSVRRPGLESLLGIAEVMPFPPLSEQAHYVERLRKTGPDRIEGDMTINDPVTLTRPWVVKLAWKRAAGLDRMFPVEFDDDRVEVQGDQLILRPSKNSSVAPTPAVSR